MKRISLIIISALLILVVTDYCVVASCLSPPHHPLTELELSDFVISGIVVSVDALEPRSKKYTGPTTHNIYSNNLIRWRIQVKDVWKGTVSDTIDVFSARSASRGYKFAVGIKYLIYGRIIKNKSEIGPWSLPEGIEYPVFKTDACTRTREYDRASEDIYFLPEPVYSNYGESRPN